MDTPRFNTDFRFQFIFHSGAKSPSIETLPQCGMVYMLGPNLIKYFPPEAENTLFTAKYEAAALIINTLQYRPLQNAAEIVFHITENSRPSSWH